MTRSTITMLDAVCKGIQYLSWRKKVPSGEGRERQQADRLAEKLRALGVDPDGV